MQIHSIGIDLGKTTFHLVALGAAGKVLVKKKFTQKQLLVYTANLQISLIGLEACSGAHFLGRALRKQGHDVRLIAAQFVKPFVKTNKNDFVDAKAIAEVVATAIVAAIGNGAAFRKGREFAAWLGVVPRQYSTGGKPRLLSISKRGNVYLRKLLIHGARAAVGRMKRDGVSVGAWLDRLDARAHKNVVVVAMANKLARTAWAVLSSGNDYRPKAMPA
jgi:transposase